MRFSMRLFGVFLAAAASLLLAAPALAHGGREVGPYELTVGFIVEPAYEGQKNGVDLRVVKAAEEENHETASAPEAPHEEAETPEPVLEVEKTLQVEVTHVPSGVSRTYALRTIFNDPGHYTADLLPTASGHYRMRFFGDIEGTPVNETFESRSGGGNFNDIQPSADLQFPEALPELREVSAAARGVQTSIQQAQEEAARAGTEAQQAQATANNAQTLGMIGLIAGLLGAVAGLGGVALALRKK